MLSFLDISEDTLCTLITDVSLFDLGLSSVAHRRCGVPDPLVPEVCHDLKFTLQVRRRQGNMKPWWKIMTPFAPTCPFNVVSGKNLTKCIYTCLSSSPDWKSSVGLVKSHTLTFPVPKVNFFSNSNTGNMLRELSFRRFTIFSPLIQILSSESVPSLYSVPFFF